MGKSIVLAGSIELQTYVPPVQSEAFIHLQKIVLLDILEVFVSSILQFVRSIFVADDDGMRVAAGS